MNTESAEQKTPAQAQREYNAYMRQRAMRLQQEAAARQRRQKQIGNIIGAILGLLLALAMALPTLARVSRYWRIQQLQQQQQIPLQIHYDRAA